MPDQNGLYRHMTLVVQLLGGCVFLIGSAALLGYIFNKPAFYHWGEDARMAKNTATALSGIGFALYTIGMLLRRHCQDEK